MTYILTDEQFKSLKDYFELAMTAISNDEQDELLKMEPGLRAMLRALNSSSSL